ncbi:hypothetical protein EVAR_29513_1 [Eumeta japonica]|uniref:Secreted protein n=1 Tax=Eumeta variegata TaxID=151549 RepID=A0A4C1WGD2_EUMVA|nr:hypothetical protein EVAR_29513_1 [Eumeta japonica]
MGSTLNICSTLFLLLDPVVSRLFGDYHHHCAAWRSTTVPLLIPLPLPVKLRARVRINVARNTNKRQVRSAMCAITIFVTAAVKPKSARYRRPRADCERYLYLRSEIPLR